MSSTEARRWLVSGRVQGVGFRVFVLEEAQRLGVSGYVRNLPDGSVEAVASGETGALERLERALRAGPPGARVERVEGSVTGDAVQLPAVFEVR